MAQVDSFLTREDRINVAKVNKELRTVFNPGLQTVMSYELIFAWTYTFNGSSKFQRGRNYTLTTSALDGKLSFRDYNFPYKYQSVLPEFQFYREVPALTSKVFPILRGYVEYDLVNLFCKRILYKESLSNMLSYSDFYKEKSISPYSSVERAYQSLTKINTTTSQKPFIVDIIDYRSNYFDEIWFLHGGPGKQEFGSPIDIKTLLDEIGDYRYPLPARDRPLDEEQKAILLRAIREVGLSAIKPLFNFSLKFQVRVEKIANPNRNQVVSQ